LLLLLLLVFAMTSRAPVHERGVASTPPTAQRSRDDVCWRQIRQRRSASTLSETA